MQDDKPHVTDSEQDSSQTVIPKINYDIRRIEEDVILISDARYRLVQDDDQAFDIEQFKDRYTDLLEKFDYIVGDVAFDKLRLRGFYENDTENIPLDMRIASLEDYLLEYCSFGAKHYVLHRLDPKTVFPDYSRSWQKKQERNKGHKKRQGRRKKSYQKFDKGQRHSERRGSKTSFKQKTVAQDKALAKDQKEVKAVKNVKDEKGQTKFTIKKQK